MKIKTLDLTKQDSPEEDKPIEFTEWLDLDGKWTRCSIFSNDTLFVVVVELYMGGVDDYRYYLVQFTGKVQTLYRRRK